jgi:hypothetical protein
MAFTLVFRSFQQIASTMTVRSYFTITYSIYLFFIPWFFIMPRKSRKNRATQDNEQEKQQSRFTWTVHAALDEAIQQDCLKKRAGQGFKAEAMLVITAAVQEKVDAKLGIRVTTNQVETKLDTVRSLSAHLPIICFFSPLLFTVILIPRQLKSRLKKYMELEKRYLVSGGMMRDTQ